MAVARGGARPEACAARVGVAKRTEEGRKKDAKCPREGDCFRRIFASNTRQDQTQARRANEAWSIKGSRLHASNGTAGDLVPVARAPRLTKPPFFPPSLAIHNHRIAVSVDRKGRDSPSSVSDLFFGVLHQQSGEHIRWPWTVACRLYHRLRPSQSSAPTPAYCTYDCECRVWMSS